MKFGAIVLRICDKPNPATIVLTKFLPHQRPELKTFKLIPFQKIQKNFTKNESVEGNLAANIQDFPLASLQQLPWQRTEYLGFFWLRESTVKL